MRAEVEDDRLALFVIVVVSLVEAVVVFILLWFMVSFSSFMLLLVEDVEVAVFIGLGEIVSDPTVLVLLVHPFDTLLCI